MPIAAQLVFPFAREKLCVADMIITTALFIFVSYSRIESSKASVDPWVFFRQAYPHMLQGISLQE
jgi:hypothetical protein